METNILKVDTKPQLDPYHRDTNGETKTVLKINPCDNTAWIDQEYDDNAVSMDEWNFLIISQSLSSRPDENEAKTYLKFDDGQYLLNRIINGWSSNWNGNNIVGHITDDAELALNELINDLENLDSTEWALWTIDEWLNQCDNLVNCDTTDEQIIEIANELEKEADSVSVVLSGDMTDYLTEKRNQLRDELE
jgi:hypothetical protein